MLSYFPQAWIESAKKIVEYSLPKDLSELEKKIQMFLRFYGHEFSETEKNKIITRLSNKHIG